MATKDSIRFLAQSIGGIGDRISQEKMQEQAQRNADRNFNLQNRYQKTSEEKFSEEKKNNRMAVAKARFEMLATMKASEIAMKMGKKPEDVLHLASKQVYDDLDDESRKALGPQFREILQPVGPFQSTRNARFSASKNPTAQTVIPQVPAVVPTMMPPVIPTPTPAMNLGNRY